MIKAKLILVSRHPNKKGDAITALGAQQAFAAALALAEQGLVPQEIISSGARRTGQTALVMAAAFGLDPLSTTITDKNFHYQGIVDHEFGGDEKAAVDDINAAAKPGATVAQALETSKFARAGREQVAAALIALAKSMDERGLDVALVVSHSQFAETACFRPDEVPFGIGEADTMAYFVDDNGVVTSDLVKAPQ